MTTEAATPVRSSSSLLKSSAVMAAGTLASRVTGFLRTAVLAAALGLGALPDVYNTANTIPNIIYDFLLGGVLTSVMVPLLVKARSNDERYGEEYEQRLFSLIIVGLAILTVVSVILAPYIIDLYGHDWSPDKHRLGVVFARWFLPEIFFYGVSAFCAAVLNTRGRFGAPMWTPVLNNVVVIAVGLWFLAIVGRDVKVGHISSTALMLLEVGTLGGIVLQTLALWPSLRRAGFRFRPRFDFRKGELREATSMGTWTLIYVTVMQVGLLINTMVANAAGQIATNKHLVSYGVGYTPYSYAYQLFQMPYAIVAVSVITALLPRMSKHAADHKYIEVGDDFATGLGLSSAVIIPAAALMFALGSEISVVIFAHANGHIADALEMGTMLKAFAIGLVPFSVFQLLLRVFYALRDTRTPALLGLVYVAITASGAYISYHYLSVTRIVVGLCVSIGVAYAVCAFLAAVLARRALGGINGRGLAIAQARLACAALPAFVIAFGVHLAVVHLHGYGTLTSLVGLLAGSVLGGAAFVVAARLMNVTEVERLFATVARRFSRS